MVTFKYEEDCFILSCGPIGNDDEILSLITSISYFFLGSVPSRGYASNKVPSLALPASSEAQSGGGPMAVMELKINGIQAYFGLKAEHSYV